MVSFFFELHHRLTNNQEVSFPLPATSSLQLAWELSRDELMNTRSPLGPAHVTTTTTTAADDDDDYDDDNWRETTG